MKLLNLVLSVCLVFSYFLLGYAVGTALVVIYKLLGVG